MVAVLLVFLLFAALQVAVFVYVRNVVSASVADGARFAATANATPRSGADRAVALLDAALSRAASHRIACQAQPSRDAASGLATVQVRCRGRLRPVLIPLGLPITVDVTAVALRERMP